jgi:hypothetical protein
MTGIEITLERPVLAAPTIALAYRNFEPILQIDGTELSGVEWNKPWRFELMPGKHHIATACRAKVNPLGLKPQYSAELPVTLESGQVQQIRYSLPRTVLGILNNGINKGRLEVTGRISGASVTAGASDPAAAPSPAPARPAAQLPPMSAPAQKSAAAAPPTVAAPAIISCSKCHASLMPDAKFCHECGQAVPKPRLCPACRQEQATGKFCSNCGTAMPA